MAKLKKKQIVDLFIAHLNEIADYTEKESRCKTTREKIRLAIFSTLTAIDGESAALPSFTLCPSPHPEDRAYHEEKGEDYYPEESERCDIAGGLHEAWRKSERD
jgi:hypothetical protein